MFYVFLEQVVYSFIAVLGCIVTALVVVNPVMAFFRPGNDDSNRWIFNLFHHFVGYSSLIISVGAISIALTQLYVVPGKSIKTKIHYIFRLDNRLVHWKPSQFYNMAWYCQIARYIQS